MNMYIMYIYVYNESHTSTKKFITVNRIHCHCAQSHCASSSCLIVPWHPIEEEFRWNRSAGRSDLIRYCISPIHSNNMNVILVCIVSVQAYFRNSDILVYGLIIMTLTRLGLKNIAWSQILNFNYIKTTDYTL